jgi:hypothetical protein
VAGAFTGAIAVRGDSASGSGQNGATPSGILGDVTLNQGLGRGGSILTSGQIGDALDQTTLTLGKSSSGTIAAAGAILASAPPAKGHKVSSAPGVSAHGAGAPGDSNASASALTALWSPDLDSTATARDLTGLQQIERNVKNYKAA